jgi:hypothetical protein
MPDRYDLRNILEKGFEVANKVQFENGQDPLDEVSFVMGFLECFGILTGGVDIGIAPGTSMGRIFDAIHEDIVAYGRRVAEFQAKQDIIRSKFNG